MRGAALDSGRSDHPAVQAQLDRLRFAAPRGDILGLGRIRALLDALGNPQNALPPTFHVAGTNGKGSTCAFLRAMLEAQGHRVHVFTSPHLVRFNERIRVAGSLIDDDVLAARLGEVVDASVPFDDALAPSFFEVGFAAALLAFTRVTADAAIIEVGLGGRLDATNILPHAAACGVASLGIDHEGFLLAPEENTPSEPMARIAFEKAGIAKTATPLVTMGALYPASAQQAIADVAAARGAIHIGYGRDWWITDAADGGLTYRAGDYQLALPAPNLVGPHQHRNAGLAIAMLRQQSAVRVDDPALQAGVAQAQWPARMQPLPPGPLRALIPDAIPLIVDGGHNADAGLALAAHIAPDARVHLIVGMLSNKDPAAIVGPLGDRLVDVTVVPVPEHDCHDAAAFVPHCHVPVTPSPDVEAALRTLSPQAEACVLIAGSLYLAGDVLARNGTPPN